MSFSSCTLLASILKMLFDNLDILGELHIASMQIIVKRENEPETSLRLDIVSLQKEKNR